MNSFIIISTPAGGKGVVSEYIKNNYAKVCKFNEMSKYMCEKIYHSVIFLLCFIIFWLNKQAFV